MPRLAVLARWALTVAGLAATSCVDATHEEQVDALGDETPGGPGPFHRPGQPCVTCHGELGPADSQFRLGGTVYLLRNAEDPAPGTVVQIQDSTGQVFTTQTNAAGNFWVLPEQWDPTYPLQVRVQYQAQFKVFTKQMNPAINRAESCGDCHVPPRPNKESPGRVYITTNRSDLTKAP
jgi:hypothetical protein